MEIWKTIKDYEQYKVSNLGMVARITKTKGLRCLNGQLNHKGYLRVHLIKNHEPHFLGCID